MHLLLCFEMSIPNGKFMAFLHKWKQISMWLGQSAADMHAVKTGHPTIQGYIIGGYIIGQTWNHSRGVEK